MLFDDPPSNERHLRSEIDRLQIKRGHGPGAIQLSQGGVPLHAVGVKRNELARLLARTLERGEYELQPAQARRLVVRDKERIVYDYRLTDRIVHGAVASLLTEAIQPTLSPNVYSYRRGVDWTQAVSDFAKYVRIHRRKRPDPRCRGLYVLRRDIYQYTDSIPLAESSAIWPLLEEVLRSGAGGEFSLEHWALLKQVIRTEFYPSDSAEGGLSTKVRGVPTGSPVAPPVFNLYLASLDRELSAVPGAFYARYCDDFLFAHPSAEMVRRVNERINEVLAILYLRTNALKDRVLYFNGAGRSSREWPAAAAVDSVSFLGCNVAFAGTISLRRRKVRRLLRDLLARAVRTCRLTGSASPDVSGPIVCAAINRALSPETRFAQKSALLLRAVVTDRAQLRQLDYQIARIVLRVLSRQTTARAFREIPWRRMREEWGLTSLYHGRNRSKR